MFFDLLKKQIRKLSINELSGLHWNLLKGTTFAHTIICNPGLICNKYEPCITPCATPICTCIPHRCVCNNHTYTPLDIKNLHSIRRCNLLPIYPVCWACIATERISKKFLCMALLRTLCLRLPRFTPSNLHAMVFSKKSFTRVSCGF
jgi:hypothetical protein